MHKGKIMPHPKGGDGAAVDIASALDHINIKRSVLWS
jgi:hypothetical protein